MARGVPIWRSSASSSLVKLAWWVASRGTMVMVFTPLVRTIWAASGSAQMLNSEAAVALKTLKPPPIKMICRIFSAMRGSRRRAMPMLVRGPVGMRVISPFDCIRVSISHQTPCSGCSRLTGAGMGRQSWW